jgi:hypothetical protein
MTLITRITPQRWTRAYQAITDIFVSGLLLLSILILISRVGVTGDAGDFIRMQAGWNSGLVLYDEIFEIKDFGFYALNAPFFALAGVSGLAFASVIWTSLFTLALYLTARLFVGTRSSIVIASSLTCLWVGGPWFYPLYTETLSLGLLTMGISLINKQRFFVSGLLLGLAVASKLVFVIPVFLTVVFLAVSVFIANRNKIFMIIRAKKDFGFISFLKPQIFILYGLLLALVMVVGLSIATGTLQGWFEVLKTNRAYQGLTGMRLNIFDTHGFALLGSALSSNPLFAIVIFLLVPCTFFLFLSAHGRKLLYAYSPALAVLIVALFGTAWAVKLQNPLGHHSQPFLGLLFMVLAFVLAATWCVLGASFLKEAKVIAPVYTLAVLGIVLMISGTPGDVLSKAQANWTNITETSDLDAYLSLFDSGKSIDLVFTSSPKFFFTSAGRLDLKCRFHGSHPIGLFTHFEEVKSCAENPAEIVVWQDRRVYGEWLGYAEFWTTQRAHLFESHRSCMDFSSDVRVMVSKGLSCPSLL